MGIEVVDATYVNKWTPADEAHLRELQQRKDDVVGRNTVRLIAVIEKIGLSSATLPSASTARQMVDNAEELRDALEPFDSGCRSARPVVAR